MLPEPRGCCSLLYSPADVLAKRRPRLTPVAQSPSRAGQRKVEQRVSAVQPQMAEDRAAARSNGTRLAVTPYAELRRWMPERLTRDRRAQR